MKKNKKINPAAAVPQAPRALRVGSRSRAADPAPEPPKPGADSEDGDEDEEDDEDGDRAKSQEAHDAAMALAADAHRGAADAADAAKGTDSAAALMAYESAHASAMESGDAARASCLSMRGAADEPTPDSQRPAPGAPPAPGAAQALSALAGSSVASQMELAQLAAFARDTLTAFGAKTIAGAAAKRDLAIAALAKMPKIEADKKLASAVARLTSACHAGMPREKAFAISKDGTLGAPLPVWSKLDPAALDEVLTAQGYPAGAPVARSTLIVAAPPELTSEAGLAARAAAAGVDIETRRAAEANINRSQIKETAR